MQRHESQRGYFAYELHRAMSKDKNILLVVGDLGYAMFDKLREDFPDRCINVGAAEQTMIGVAVGLALEGKIPVVYSITNFLLYRPFETIRNYIDYEKIPVKLIGGGRDMDYHHDGISHWSEDAQSVLGLFKNIESFFPDSKLDITDEFVKEILYTKKAIFLSLRR